jgi:inward rectifier potassium channel
MAEVQQKVLSGFDTNTGNTAGRLFTAGGQPNVERKGTNFLNRFSIYHTLLNMSFRKYIILILFSYFMINLLFATIYFILGADKLGLDASNSCNSSAFSNCFFFSAQTLTTVGYGRISPTAFSTNALSAFESLLGLLLFSVITGLSYARFAKPESKIMFSKNMLLVPYKGGKALMFRMVSPTDHLLTDAEVIITLAILEKRGDKMLPQFYNLTLESNKATSLPLNWTVVHFIAPDSPLANIGLEQFEALHVEFLIFVKAYDENYSNHVQQRASYMPTDIVDNAKFKPMFYRNEEGTSTILEINKLSDYTLVQA